MTPIFGDRIDHLMAWHGRDLCKEDISFDLSRRHVAALEDVLLSLRKGVWNLAKSARNTVGTRRSTVISIRYPTKSKRAARLSLYAACRSKVTPSTRSA
jgi:hypothetical protein